MTICKLIERHESETMRNEYKFDLCWSFKRTLHVLCLITEKNTTRYGYWAGTLMDNRWELS